MINRYRGMCHFCESAVDANEGQAWKWPHTSDGRWYTAHNGCAELNRERKRNERTQRTKTVTPPAPAPKTEPAELVTEPAELARAKVASPIVVIGGGVVIETPKTSRDDRPTATARETILREADYALEDNEPF